MIISPYVIASL